MVQEGPKSFTEIKEIPTEQKDRVIFDRPTRKWEYGERRDRVLAMTLYTWFWSDVQADCQDVAPDVDYILDVEFCESIYIQCSTVNALTVGANTDFNVETSPDGVNWDTIPFATINLGANVVASMLVAVGMRYIRMRLDENASAIVWAKAICKRLK